MKDDAFRAFCEGRKAANQWRRLIETEFRPHGRALRDGREFISFASNDYLGLSRHPELIGRAQKFTEIYGAGSAAARLLGGNIPAYAEIEQRLAAGKNCEAVLVMNSGYQVNLTVLSALTDSDIIGKPATILADRLCHNSLLQGALLSGARLVRYHHNDMDHLASLLREQTEKGAQSIIVSESVFGMDGDRADLAALTKFAQEHDALLYIDEAHATGVFGPGGFGLCAEHEGKIDIAMGTFGKALGSFGAYIGCRASVRDFLIQRCGGFIYSTALPPPTLGSILAALELLPALDQERAHLLQQADRLRMALVQQGWNCGASTTQIIPVILGGEEAAAKLSAALFENGILAPPIRPPTVPRGTSRLRLSLSAAHSAEDIDRLITLMNAQTGSFAHAA